MIGKTIQKVQKLKIRVFKSLFSIWITYQSFICRHASKHLFSNFLINQLVIIATVLNYHFKYLNCTIIIAGFLNSRSAVLVRNCFFFSKILFSYHGFAFLEFKNCHFFGHKILIFWKHQLLLLTMIES